MKAIVSLVILLLTASGIAQMSQVEGTYRLQLVNTEENKIEYHLTLNPDGSFYFHAYTNRKMDTPTERNQYGKGSWKAVFKKKFSTEYVEVLFSSDKTRDSDEQYTLDFNDTVARLITKSPRDKSDAAVKDKLRFIRSDIFWVQGIDLLRM